MTRPEWVEAGARALVGGTNYVMSGDNGVAGTMNRLTAEFVIRAVEPLIRADERGKAHAHSTGTDTGGPCCECCYEVNQGPCSHDLTLHDEKIRAQIAADIEAARDHFAERTGTPREHPLCRAYDDAARIARGES